MPKKKVSKGPSKKLVPRPSNKKQKLTKYVDVRIPKLTQTPQEPLEIKQAPVSGEIIIIETKANLRPETTLESVVIANDALENLLKVATKQYEKIKTHKVGFLQSILNFFIGKK